MAQERLYLATLSFRPTRNRGLFEEDKKHVAAKSFHLFASKRLGSRLTQQSNFIVDREQNVPAFYGKYGANLTAWKGPAPKIKPDKSGSSDVLPESISEEADSFKDETAQKWFNFYGRIMYGWRFRICPLNVSIRHSFKSTCDLGLKRPLTS